jgi:hypothetical protein
MARNVVDSVKNALSRAKRDLMKEMKRISDEIAKIDSFIGASVGRGRGRRKGSAGRRRGGKRRISAAGRARIAAAQRRRWAKTRAAKKAPKAAKS